MKKNPTIIAACLALPLFALASCKEKSSAERAGEKVDKAVENVKDAVNPKGPIEKAGEKIDKAVENVKDAVDPQGPGEKVGEKIDKALGH